MLYLYGHQQRGIKISVLYDSIFTSAVTPAALSDKRAELIRTSNKQVNKLCVSSLFFTRCVASHCRRFALDSIKYLRLNCTEDGRSDQILCASGSAVCVTTNNSMPAPLRPTHRAPRRGTARLIQEPLNSSLLLSDTV